MTRSHLLLALSAFATASAAFAAAPFARPAASGELDALVEQLGHRDYRARELAEKRIRAEGQAALPALRKALSHKNLEVRRRALRLVPALETARLFAPRRVTFSVRDQPLAKVLEGLSKASGYKVMDQNAGFFPFGGPRPARQGAKEQTFTYDFVNEPFWDVIGRLCRDASLTVQQSYGDEIVRLSRTDSHAPLTGRHGPFRYVGNNVQLHRTVDLSSREQASKRNETLTFNFTVYAEPRLPLMSMGEVRLESAYDDLKNSMVVQRAAEQQNEGPSGLGMRFGRRSYAGNYKQMAIQVSVPLERRSERASRLKSLKGVLPMTVLVEQKPMLISDKILSAKGTKKQIGELTFEIKEVKKLQGNQVSVQFTITNKNTTDYSWQNNLYNRLELLDDKGNKYRIWGTSWGGAGPSNVNMTLTFNNSDAQKPGEPAKFSFVHWETKMYDVEFEFRDVPLP